MKSLDKFKKDYTGVAVGVPLGFVGECVSLVQRYINEVYGIEIKPRGNGKEWATAMTKAGLGEITKSPKPGDLVVWGGDVAGGYGHVAIYIDEKNVFDQSNGQRKTAQVRPTLSSKPIAYIRMNTNKEIGGVNNMKIALDAGHGKNTAGKRTPDGIREWSLNETVLRGFQDTILTYKNVTTIRLDDPTGNTDIRMSTRTNKANNAKADYLISFHHNANTGAWGSWGGTETFIHAKGTNSEALANVLQRSMVSSLKLRDRGVKVGNLHMVRETRMPSALVEVGFMDSNTDKIIRDSSARYRAGVNMANAFAKQYKLSKKSVAPSKPAPSKPAPSKPAPVKPAPVKPSGNIVAEKGEFILSTAVYERNNPTLKNKSGLNLRKKGERLEYNAYVIAEGHNWVRLLNNKWIPWRETDGDKFGKLEDVKKKAKATNIGQYANMQGHTWLFAEPRKDDTYSSRGRVKAQQTTSLRARSAKILADDNGRVKVNIPGFNPSTIWLAKSQVTITQSPRYPIR